ncbi:MAG: hypothetical protein V1793_25440 [Pseudomonadota bacterium]
MKHLLNIFFFFRSFTGIIIYWGLILGAGVETDTAALTALSFVLFYSLVAMAADRIVSLDFGLAIFFFVGYLLCVFLPEWSLKYLIERFTTFLYLSLFITSYVPFVFGIQPFTVIIAKRITPPEIWETREFNTITRIMALVWCALFLTACLVSLRQGFITQMIIPIGIMLFIGFPFNRYFRDFYLKVKGIS